MICKILDHRLFRNILKSAHPSPYLSGPYILKTTYFSVGANATEESEYDDLQFKANNICHLVAQTGKAAVLANWRRLRQSMSIAQVRQLLGESRRISAGSGMTETWCYNEVRRCEPVYAVVAYVGFIRDGVSRWNEP